MLVFSITACTQQNNDSNEIDETKQQNVTLYSLTGTMQINAADIEEYLENGWYTEPVVTMYAADGRTIVIKETEINIYKSIGWFSEPQVSNTDSVNNEFSTNDYFLNFAKQNAQSAYKKSNPEGVDGTFNFNTVEKVSDSFVIVSGTMTIFNGMEFYGYCYIIKENGMWCCSEAGYIFGAED